MLFTTLIDQVTLSTIDTRILEQLKAKVAEIKTVRQQHMVIGICNHEGAIYNVVGVTGRRVFMDTIDKFAGLNMTDELKEATRPVKGYDAIFKPE